MYIKADTPRIDEIRMNYAKQLNEQGAFILQHLTTKELSKRFGFVYSKSRL